MNCRSPNGGRLDVRHLPIAEKDEIYEDHTDVVQEVGSRSRGVYKEIRLGCARQSRMYSAVRDARFLGVDRFHGPFGRMPYHQRSWDF